MKSSLEPQFETQFDSMPDDSAAFAYSMQEGAMMGARACVVNRTHRVVRERAKSMHERRSTARSLMVPLIICSALLILLVVIVWGGLYLEAAEAAEAVQADVSALTATDINNHIVVVLLWFVPLSIALLAAVSIRRSRRNSNDEAL
jgi:NADH:ubiquinone oxidoreductase subunit 6 (subunit J)